MRKAITNEELIHLVDEYHFDHPGQKIKIPAFGKYVREKGFDVEDHTIRRYKDCRAYIDSLNNKTSETAENELVTYKTIDADAFIDANKNRSDLKRALIERDSYYSRVASNAVNAIKEKQSMLKEIENLKNKISTLEYELEKAKAKYSGDLKLVETNKMLKKILDEYVYPDIANIMLEKEGLVELEDTIVSKDKINIISANTNIKNITEQSSETSSDISEFSTISHMVSNFGKR